MCESVSSKTEVLQLEDVASATVIDEDATVTVTQVGLSSS